MGNSAGAIRNGRATEEAKNRRSFKGLFHWMDAVQRLLGQLAIARGYMTGSPAINATVRFSQVAFGLGLDILIRNRSFDAASIIGIIPITATSSLRCGEEPGE